MPMSTCRLIYFKGYSCFSYMLDFNASLLHPTLRCLPYEVIKQKLQEEFQPPNENEIKQERIETVRMAIEKMLRKYHPQNVSQQDRGSVREEDIPRWILHKEERHCQQKEEEDKTEELMTFARKGNALFILQVV